MKLIGMLDSPYVRRVAVGLQCLGLRFEHQALSVFRTFEQFRAINPVVKAPTLLCDDGTVLMDSTLILAYAQALAPARRLRPAGLAALQRELRIEGLALAATEKAVQAYYETGLRPAESRHAPWLERVTGQAHAAFAALDTELAQLPRPAALDGWTQAGLSAAIAWTFTHRTVPALVDAAHYPALLAWTDAAEALAPMRAAPHGNGTVAQAA